MRRRDFIKRMGIGAAALSVASHLVIPTIRNGFEQETIGLSKRVEMSEFEMGVIDRFIKAEKDSGNWDLIDSAFIPLNGKMTNIKG